MGGFTPMLKQLGYTGPVSREISMGGGVDESGREMTGEGLAPEAMAWLQDQGYTINDIYDSKSKSRFLQAVDPDGQPVGQWKYQSRGLTPLQAAAAVWGLGYGIGNLASGLGATSAAPSATGHGAWLGEGIASGIPTWDAAATTAGMNLAGTAGAGSLLDAAAVDAMVKAGSLAPEGVAALIPEGATLGGAGALTGGAFSNAVSGASLWDKAKNLITGKTGIGSLLPDNATDWAKLLTTIGGGYAAYKDAKKPQLQGYGGSINAKVPTQTIEQSRYGPISRVGFAAGGIAGLPRYLNSPHDGMGDGIAASIDGQKSAALSGGEFVVPADVVSHLGNGNSQAGAQQLFAMMDRVRQERTGTRQQGRQIDPLRMMPR